MTALSRASVAVGTALHTGFPIPTRTTGITVPYVRGGTALQGQPMIENRLVMSFEPIMGRPVFNQTIEVISYWK